MLACASSTAALTRDTHACPWRTERRRQLSLVGDSASEPPPNDANIRTCAFPESARARVTGLPSEPVPDADASHPLVPSARARPRDDESDRRPRPGCRSGAWQLRSSGVANVEVAAGCDGAQA